MSGVEILEIPMSVVNCARSKPWFRSYKNLEEAVVDAIKDFLEAKSSANIVHVKICQQHEIAGYRVRRGKVFIEVDMDTYLQFEEAAKRGGKTVNQTLGHGIYALVEDRAET